MTYCVKLTNKNMQTYGGYQWVLGEKRTTSGKGGLCGPGWLHCYDSAEVATFMYPHHVAFGTGMLAFEADGAGQTLDDHGLKRGYSEMTLTGQIELPVLTTEQRAEIAIRCSMLVCDDPEWREWAERWLDGSDRSATSAAGAEWADWVAWAAASAAIPLRQIIMEVINAPR